MQTIERPAIDPRICPPENALEWASNHPFNAEEQAAITHSHGILVGSLESAPPMVLAGIGIRTLKEIRELGKSVDAKIADQAEVGTPIERIESSVAQLTFGSGLHLHDTIVKLRYENRKDEIVPKILSKYDLQEEYPTGVVKNLQILAHRRKQIALKIRSRALTAIGSELEHDLAITIYERHWSESPIEIAFEDDEQGEIEGVLTDIHTDSEGTVWLDVETPNGPRRVQ